MKALILIAGLLVCSGVYAAKPTEITVQLIIDDSGVLLEGPLAQTNKLKLLGHLKALLKKRSFSQARLEVISTSKGRTVWSGSLRDLKARAVRQKDLVEAIQAQKNRCNNLGGAFEELKANLQSLERQGVNTAYVIVFSSLIETPSPCHGLEQITLPQEPPVQAQINQALTASEIVKDLRFYWVSPHQLKLWQDYLSPSFAWANKRAVPMMMLDINRSAPALDHALNLGGGL